MLFIFLGTLGISHSSLFSQDITKDTLKLREVEIRSSFTVRTEGFKKIRLDSNLLIPQLNADLSTILVQHSTVFIKTYGNGSLATPSMRGTSASHTQVEWNGININSPTLGMSDFSQIPVFEFNDIEILYGAAGITKTGGAFGGVINLVTNPDWNNKFRIIAAQTAGSFNTISDNLSVSAGNQNIQSVSKVYYSYSKNNFPFFDLGVKYYQQLGKYEYFGGSEEAFFRLSPKTFVSTRIWYNHSLINIPPLLTNTSSILKGNQENSDLYAKVEWKRLGRKNILTVWTGMVDHFMIYSETDSIGTTVSNTHSYSWLNRLRWVYSGMKYLTIRPGIDYNYDVAKSDGYYGNKYRITVSGFSEFVFTRIKNLSLNLVVRQELMDNRFLPVIAAFGTELDPFGTHHISLTFNVSKNYKFPTLNDLFWKDGNPNLKPETDYSGELGLVCNAATTDNVFFIETEITGYYSKMEDLINWKPNSDGKFRPENVAEVLARGIEAGLNFKLEKWGFRFTMNNNYHYCRSTNEKIYDTLDASLGKQLIYLPVHTFNTTMTLRKWDAFATCNFSFFSKRFTSADNKYDMPSYYLTNIIAGKDFHIFKILLSLQLQINNLFDVDYQSILNRPMPGRNMAVTLKFNFGK